MESLEAVGFLLVLILWGLFIRLRDLRALRATNELANTFLEELKKYWNSGGSDMGSYGWLLHRSNKIQNLMGSQGIMHGYKPPYQDVMYRHYPIILNMLPELRSALEDEILSRNVAHQYANALQEAVLRFIGSVDDQIEETEKELRNPVKWFREGVREVVAFPTYLLGWLGLVKEGTAQKIVASSIFKAFSGLVALAGFLSALVTIVVGWEAFVKVIGNG